LNRLSARLKKHQRRSKIKRLKKQEKRQHR
jgi:hypothetical protein